MHHVLFIDDEPNRIIARVPAEFREWFIVACGEEQIRYYLAGSRINFHAVCCDHDMGEYNGVRVVKDFLVFRSIPVVVHSANHPAAMTMVDLLRESATPCFYAPILNPDWWKEVQSWSAFPVFKTTRGGKS